MAECSECCSKARCACCKRGAGCSTPPPTFHARLLHPIMSCCRPVARFRLQVDISNSFEMRCMEGTDDIDEAFLQKKMEQCEWVVFCSFPIRGGALVWNNVARGRGSSASGSCVSVAGCGQRPMQCSVGAARPAACCLLPCCPAAERLPCMPADLPSSGCTRAGLLMHLSSACPLPPADKQPFPQEDVVGWYATGTEISDADMAIQRKVGCWVVHGDNGGAHAMLVLLGARVLCSEAGSG